MYIESMKKSVKVVLGAIAVLLLLVGIAFLLQSKKWEGFATEKTVSFYYLPGCSWCEKFKPEWKKFESSAKDNGIVTRAVNAQENEQEVSKKQIKGFPTVLVTSNGKEVEYNGERTSEALLAFVKKA